MNSQAECKMACLHVKDLKAMSDFHPFHSQSIHVVTSLIKERWLFIHKKEEKMNIYA